jgi:hypothetical protein
MKATKIIADDIFGSKSININTPIIILRNVTFEYLLPVGNGIFNVDMYKLQRDLENSIQFIDKFVPIGQIDTNNGQKLDRNWQTRLFTLPMANTRMIHVTNTFEEISNGVWIGIIRKSGKDSRTIGTIYSKNIPKTLYPVFPSTFLNKQEKYGDTNESNNDYSDVYSDNSYGHWTLNVYKFNVDKTQLKMINSTGEMSNMYIPKATVPKDILDVGYGNDDYDRKVYFTAQGTIVSDANCVSPINNMSKMSIKECNGSAISISDSLYGDYNGLNSFRANDDDQLTLMLNEMSDYNDSSNMKLKKKTFSRGKKLVLREKDEPWFSDSGIVGSVASITNPHKITGIIDGENIIPLTNENVIVNTKINQRFGTIDGNENETQSPYQSVCKSSGSGYSRYDQNNNCIGDNKVTETFVDNNTNLDYTNNCIIYAMCIIIILLLLYRRR